MEYSAGLYMLATQDMQRMARHGLGDIELGCGGLPEDASHVEVGVFARDQGHKRRHPNDKVKHLSSVPEVAKYTWTHSCCEEGGLSMGGRFSC